MVNVTKIDDNYALNQRDSFCSPCHTPKNKTRLPQAKHCNYISLDTQWCDICVLSIHICYTNDMTTTIATGDGIRILGARCRFFPLIVEKLKVEGLKVFV